MIHSWRDKFTPYELIKITNDPIMIRMAKLLDESDAVASGRETAVHPTSIELNKLNADGRLDKSQYGAVRLNEAG